MATFKIYTNEDELINDFKNDILTPQMLKKSMSKTMDNLLIACINSINDNPIALDAYNTIMKLREENKKNKNKIKNKK